MKELGLTLVFIILSCFAYILFFLFVPNSDIDITKVYGNIDYIKKFKNAQKACNNGNMKSCNNLGDLYTDEHILKQDYTKAKKYYQEACDGGYMAGCYYLGMLYERERDVEQYPLKSIEYLEKACSDISVIGCHYLGMMYDGGWGVEKDPLKAKEYYEKACDRSKEGGAICCFGEYGANTQIERGQKIEEV
jgi:TPR repeat protein